jgi:hypothetical protein
LTARSGGRIRIQAVSRRTIPSRAVAGGMDRKARERHENTRPVDAQQAGDLRDMA